MKIKAHVIGGIILKAHTEVHCKKIKGHLKNNFLKKNENHLKRNL